MFGRKYNPYQTQNSYSCNQGRGRCTQGRPYPKQECSTPSLRPMELTQLPQTFTRQAGCCIIWTRSSLHRTSGLTTGFRDIPSYRILLRLNSIPLCLQTGGGQGHFRGDTVSLKNLVSKEDFFTSTVPKSEGRWRLSLNLRFMNTSKWRTFGASKISSTMEITCTSWA